MSELGPEAREILQKGRLADEPTAADRARVKRALIATIAASAAATAAEQGAQAAAAKGAGSASAFYAMTGWKALVGVLVIGAAVGTAGLLPEKKPPFAKPMIHRAVALLSLPQMQRSAEEPENHAETNAPLPPSPLQNPQPSKAKSIASAGDAEPNDTLSEETQRLMEAHGALQGGDAEKALQLLDEKEAGATGQKLKEERAAARVLALCKIGRIDEANREAAVFLEKSPRSPLAERVRKACPKNP